MKKIILICIGFCLLTGTHLFAGGSSDKSQPGKAELKISHTQSTAEDMHIAGAEMAKRITERSKGNFTVQVYPNGELGGYNDNLEQMSRGVNLMVTMSPDFLATYEPDFGILDGPFLFNDYTEFGKVQNSPWFATAAKRLEDKGIKILSMKWYFGARHIAAKKVVSSPADLRGVRFRTAPSLGRIAMTAAFGANPIQMNWQETYNALNQGIVEACEAPLSTLHSSKIYEVCKNIALTGHIRALLTVDVSTKWWNGLSAEYQKLLKEEVDNGEKDLNARTSRKEAEWQKKLESEGAIFNANIDKDAFRKSCEAFYKEFASKWTPGLYETMRAILK